MLRRSMMIGTAVVLALALSPLHAADSVPANVAAAVADKARPDADRTRDANRKPGELVAFAGIKAGDKVMDLLPGGGYFTRIFSKVVGDKGIVYAAVPPPPPNAPPGRDMAAGVKAIAVDYKNVRVVDLGSSPEPLDLAWTSNNYHDLHNRPNADLTAFNKQVFDALKPGGTYIVIDHAAEKGSGAAATSTLHRIDPELVKKEVESVGFKLEGESKVLANPSDPHNVPNRDGAVAGFHTDQFVFKFRKPK